MKKTKTKGSAPGKRPPGKTDSVGVRKKVCYLAGKMRGVPDYNRPAFKQAAEALTEAGWTVISPADMDDEAGDIPEGLQENEIVDAQQVRRIVRRDLDAILTLRAEQGDALIVLPGWMTSVGAMAEVMVAKWLHLPIFQISSIKPIRLDRIEVSHTAEVVKDDSGYSVA